LRSSLERPLKGPGSFIAYPNVAELPLLDLVSLASRANLMMFSQDKKSPWQQVAAIAPVKQILMAEDRLMRTVLIQRLGQIKEKTASSALAQRALFEFDPEIRGLAVQALKLRAAEEYLPVLLDGLRYPWPRIAGHAAEALATIRLRKAIPNLIGMLEEPDPARPFQTSVAGKNVWAVRDVVRINHFKNCYLCHAPSLSNRDEIMGLVPSPDRPLPPTRTNRYYAGKSGQLVRADITYLRQDFSVPLAVEKPGRWPNQQRFDFVVRVRPLEEKEMAAIKKADAVP